MRKIVKISLWVSLVLFSPVLYVMLEVLFHRNENYKEKNFDVNLMAPVLSPGTTNWIHVYPDTIEVFLSKDAHEYYAYSRKGYRKNHIQPTSVTTEPLKIEKIINAFRETFENRNYVDIPDKKSADQRYDVFCQFAEKVYAFSIWKTEDRYYLDDHISSPRWLSESAIDIIGLLGIAPNTK